MKYYRPTYNFNGNPHEGDYRTSQGTPVDVPINTDIWAVAYEIDNNTNQAFLRCKPVLGQIIEDKHPTSRYRFAPYDTYHKKLLKSGRVSFQCRRYADTYEEAKEMYNELVNQRISELQDLIETTKSDLLP